MPHKHRRSKRQEDESNFDLPPTINAKPLPVSISANQRPKSLRNKSRPEFEAQASKGKRKTRNDDSDDTPKEWKRLMQWQQGKQKPSSGLDDGADLSNKSKKRKRNTDDGVTNGDYASNTNADFTQDIPKIMPGERLRDYSARVDAALPVRGLVRGKKVDTIEHRQTRMEKRMQKMQNEWREVDRKLKVQREEELAEQKEREEEELEKAGMTLDEIAQSKRRKSKNKKKGKNGNGNDDDDPWAIIKEKHKDDQPRSINDIAKEPPQFTRLPKEVFKVKNGAKVQVGHVPSKVGSLARREELEAERRDVVEAYRRMVEKRKRGSSN